MAFPFPHLSFVSGPLKVEFEVHLDIGRQQVVHHGESDVLLVVHVHVHSEKLGQQRVRILDEGGYVSEREATKTKQSNRKLKGN